MQHGWQKIADLQQQDLLFSVAEMVDKCLADYDQHGWKVPHLRNNDDINQLDNLLK
ncbi:hypothetical protein ISX56_29820 [Serratia ureilytica]|nr:hypothetical protein [Serratia ureilytica]